MTMKMMFVNEKKKTLRKFDLLALSHGPGD